MLERLRDPAIVARVKREMLQPGKDWENLYFHAGPEGVLLASLTEPSLKPLIGRTIAEAARIRGVTPEQLVIDLTLADALTIAVVPQNPTRRSPGDFDEGSPLTRARRDLFDRGRAEGHRL
jgi:hypothetical protein